MVTRFKATWSARRRVTAPNPPLAIFANPPGEVQGQQVYAVEYQHAEDGKNYRHDFVDRVELVALPNGDALLRRANRADGPLWEDF